MDLSSLLNNLTDSWLSEQENGKQILAEQAVSHQADGERVWQAQRVTWPDATGPLKDCAESPPPLAQGLDPKQTKSEGLLSFLYIGWSDYFRSFACQFWKTQVLKATSCALDGRFQETNPPTNRLPPQPPFAWSTVLITQYSVLHIQTFAAVLFLQKCFSLVPKQ